MRAGLMAALIAFAAMAAAIHGVLLWRSPVWATDYQIEQGLKRGGDWNTMIYGKPPRAGATKVGLASPDTLSARAYLDLGKGPLVLEGMRPDKCAYWSASVFAHDTDAVLIRSDRDLPSGRIALALRTRKQEVAEPVDGAAVLPSSKGVLLLRCFMRDRTDAAYVAELSREVRGLSLRPARRMGS